MRDVCQERANHIYPIIVSIQDTSPIANPSELFRQLHAISNFSQREISNLYAPSRVEALGRRIEDRYLLIVWGRIQAQLQLRSPPTTASAVRKWFNQIPQGVDNPLIRLRDLDLSSLNLFYSS